MTRDKTIIAGLQINTEFRYLILDIIIVLGMYAGTLQKLASVSRWRFDQLETCPDDVGHQRGSGVVENQPEDVCTCQRCDWLAVD